MQDPSWHAGVLSDQPEDTLSQENQLVDQLAGTPGTRLHVAALGGAEQEATGAGEERAWDFFQQAETLQTHCGRVLRRTRSNPSG